MCGILAIVNLKNDLKGNHLAAASRVIRHRGPDDEGFLTWVPDEQPAIWAGANIAASTQQHWGYQSISPDQSFKVGFGHRRLSILDLSPLGHQPMVYASAGLSITFNGEVYNYLEIKEELLKLGHKFSGTSDTEVILHAWEVWGVKCLDKFNGMFSFVILDHKKQELYAVRDRFGVKPLYYYKSDSAIYLSSEIKQIRTAPGFRFELNESVAAQFLAYGTCEHGDNTFYKGIRQIQGGHYLRIDLSKAGSEPEIKKWYTLTPKRWNGNYNEAVTEFKTLLTDAVSLRLRSDVKVGSCLSGGLDSSSIVCIAADLLKAKGDFAGQETITACYDDAKYDEWNFAQEVIKKTNARPHRVFPSFGQLQQELDAFLWHQDEPVASTSVFSQWAVFKGTNEAGLKVMIDGQGADEQLAGYGGNDIPLYAGLLKKARLSALLDESKHYKKEKGAWPKGFLLSALQLNNNIFSKVLPAHLRLSQTQQKIEWMQNADVKTMYDKPAASLQESLLRQLYGAPLPALLRYEDHNSMAWSVESRTPFMDYRLLEFNLGLPEEYIYKRGVRKTILRDAMHGVIPAAIENRKDKMGFVTPEELWIKGEGREWFISEVDKACQQFGGTLLHAANVKQHVVEMINGKRPFDFMPWRIICFNKWYNSL
ncbi:MAG: asnB [Flavipsychrobacter sp.]|nr:asnB [Flavipsychrobacter sp.]